MADRNPRDIESRDKTTRAQQTYQPPSTLPDPLPQEGYKFRWIATHVMGSANTVNVSNKLRDGWVAVKAADHPELQITGNKDGNVEVGGLMLCKAPVEFIEARNAYYNRQSQAQLESVNSHYMRQQDARMPLLAESSSSVSRGGGKFGSGKS